MYRDPSLHLREQVAMLEARVYELFASFGPAGLKTAELTRWVPRATLEALSKESAAVLAVSADDPPSLERRRDLLLSFVPKLEAAISALPSWQTDARLLPLDVAPFPTPDAFVNTTTNVTPMVARCTRAFVRAAEPIADAEDTTASTKSWATTPPHFRGMRFRRNGAPFAAALTLSDRSDALHVEIATSVSAAAPPLALTAAGMTTDLLSRIGLLREVEIGSEIFDSLYRVVGDDDWARAVLDDVVRAHLLRAARYELPEITLSRGRAVGSFQFWLGEDDVADACVVGGVLDALTAIREASARA